MLLNERRQSGKTTRKKNRLNQIPDRATYLGMCPW